MSVSCPHCQNHESKSPKTIRFGSFYRKSDSRIIQRYFCQLCRKSFCSGSTHPCYRQKKRQMNDRINQLLCSGVSQRRIARVLHLSRTTVVRKFLFLGREAHFLLQNLNLNLPLSEIIEFDDLETFEHTKCKPLSVTLVVEHRSRRILGFEVARMPAKGRLAQISRKKYGKRADERKRARERLFQRIKPFVRVGALIKSDENPHYPESVKRHFPNSVHEAFKGKRGSIVGQGELKKVRFDPLFSLNHSCAMLRANINRLFRKTWCTTKVPERLAHHIALYSLYHNLYLIN